MDLHNQPSVKHQPLLHLVGLQAPQHLVSLLHLLYLANLPLPPLGNPPHQCPLLVRPPDQHLDSHQFRIRPFQTNNPAFGQPAPFGRPTTSFGQLSSAPGQPSTQAPTFGQPSSQNSAFGKSSIQASTFGQPSTHASAFGLPSATPPFAGSSQSDSTANTQYSSPFGAPQTSTFNQGTGPPKSGAFPSPSVRNEPSPFSQPPIAGVQPSFLQTSIPPSSSFGSASPPSSGGPFERPTTASQSPFGQPSTQQQPSTLNTSTTINQTSSAPSANVAAARRPSIHLPRENLGTKDAQGKLRTWKGREVRYIDDSPHYRETNDGEWKRIWFPDGPPNFTKTDDAPEAAYDAATKEKYKFAMEQGRFGDGGMPIMPPRKEWCSWNF